MTEKTARAAYARLPLAFVPNAGQLDRPVRYSAQAGGASFYFTQTAAVFSFAKGKKGSVLRLAFLGANPAATIEGRRLGTGKVNYLLGSDPAIWRTNLSTYQEVVYRRLWPGIDVVFRGANGQLKYEFLIRPGAKVSAIRLAYRGAKGLSLAKGGALRIQTPLGVLTDTAPKSYQLAAGRCVALASRYVLQGGLGYGFALGSYDPALPLVIDPGLVYSTYLGGTGSDRGSGIAVDGKGNAYVTGVTQSTDFPTTTGAFQPAPRPVAPSGDAFVTKLNTNASGAASLVYSTYLGGISTDVGSGIALDFAGNAYVAGLTESTDFPTTAGAFQPAPRPAAASGDAFVTKLNPGGTALVYSTYLGGSGIDQGVGIAIDGRGGAYVTGLTQSTDFPTTAGAFQPAPRPAAASGDAFVTKLNAGGTALVYSTYLGGSRSDVGVGIAIDGTGGAYVTGPTQSTDFPTTAGAFQPAPPPADGVGDAFVTKLNTNASGAASLVYSTYLGGTSSDLGEGIAVDGGGNAYVTGITVSTDFPTTAGAFQPAPRPAAASGDAFVTKLNTNASGAASLVYSTYLGGTSSDRGEGIAVDGGGNAYATGSTVSTDFPTTAGAFQSAPRPAAASGDAFVTKLNPGGTALVYSTYLGGSAIDQGFGIAVKGGGSAYVTGDTQSTDFPTTAGAFQPAPRPAAASRDAFVTKLDLTAGCPPSDDEDADGLIDSRELLLLTLLGNPDSDLDGIKDGNDDANGNGEDDEDEDDDDECPDDDNDGDGVDDEDEDD